MDREQYEILFRLEGSHWWYLGMQRVVDAFLDRYLDHGRALRILDAGCGTGGMLERLRRYGRVVGVDVADEALALCRRRDLTALARGSIERLPFASDSFDLLVSFDVIYHKAVEDDLLALREFWRVLKPGGLMVVRVPAYDWLRGAHDIAVHTRHRYSRSELAGKLRAAGFSIEKLTHVNALLFPVAALKRLLEGRRPALRPDLELPSPSVNRALFGVLALESAMLRLVSFPWGLSLMAVVTKGQGVGQPATIRGRRE